MVFILGGEVIKDEIKFKKDKLFLICDWLYLFLGKNFFKIYPRSWVKVVNENKYS